MTSATSTRRRAVRDGLLLAGLIFNLTVVLVWGKDLYLWSDARSWEKINLDDLYSGAMSSLVGEGPFRYSPAIAWLFYPISLLPLPAIIVIWLGLDLAAVLLLARRQTILALVCFPPVLLEMLNGNIHLLMAVAIWAAFRWPAAWAFILLTKVTPGVGLLWFVGRRDWRNLAFALATTGAIVVAGTLAAPDLWAGWARFLVAATGMSIASPLPPLVIRLSISAAIATYAGHTGRAWLIPVACFLAMPTIWIQSAALLLACVPLWLGRERWSRRGRVTSVVEPDSAKG